MTKILPLALLFAWSTSCDKKEEAKKDEARKDARGPIDGDAPRIPGGMPDDGAPAPADDPPAPADDPASAGAVARDPVDDPAPELRSPKAYRSWSFGVTDYDPLFRFTAADWDSTRPAYCKSPLTMLEQIKLEIDANPRGCSPVKVTEDDTGLYLRLKCSVPDDVTKGCQLVYRGTLEASLEPGSTTDYELRAQGSIRRFCESSADAGFPASASAVTQADAASRSVTQITNRCKGIEAGTP